MSESFTSLSFLPTFRNALSRVLKCCLPGRPGGCHASHRAGRPSLPGPVPGQRVSILTQPLQPAVAGAFTGHEKPWPLRTGPAEPSGVCSCRFHARRACSGQSRRGGLVVAPPARPERGEVHATRNFLPGGRKNFLSSPLSVLPSSMLLCPLPRLDRPKHDNPPEQEKCHEHTERQRQHRHARISQNMG